MIILIDEYDSAINRLFYDKDLITICDQTNKNEAKLVLNKLLQVSNIFADILSPCAKTEEDKIHYIEKIVLTGIFKALLTTGQSGLNNFADFGVISNEKYAKYSEQGLILFWYFVSVWSLYGVAALFPYNLKNIFYNILDLFAKNFFGLYLAYIIWHNKI